MERIPEPDLMDEPAQALAYARADFEEPHQALIDKLKSLFPSLPTQGVALDLGCGPGDISIRFAQAFPAWNVDGVDGAASMLNLGREDIKARELDSRIQLYEVYLPQDSAPKEAYDFIFSNSLLHHLAEPMDLWRSLLALSQSHTPVFIMDLMRPESREQAEAMKLKYAAGEPEVLQTDFFNSLLAAYSLDEVRGQLESIGLSHLNLEATSDRHWIAWGYPMDPERHV